MHKIKVGAASVRYRTHTGNSRVLVARYGGLLCAKALVGLRGAVISQAPPTDAFIVRLDGAELMMGVDTFIPKASDYSAIADGCVVCRADQMDAMLVYSRHMAANGVIRSVFLDSEFDQAEAFALRHVEIHQGVRRR